MRGMVVAAGFGTRLSPLTDELPKPAVPVANRPVAWFALDHLARSGIAEVVVNTHHLAERLRSALEPVAPAGMSLAFAHEPTILGTGGGVRNAWRPQPGEDFLVFNGKLVFAPDLARALAVHRDSGAIATLVLRPLPPGAGFAPVEVDGEGRVRRARGLPEGVQGEGFTRAMFTGVQVLSARAHRDLPTAGDIFEHAYLPWLERGETVMGVLDDAPWLDVGVSVAHYLEANLSFARGELSWPGVAPPRPGGVIASTTAEVAADGELRQVVLGEGARVLPGARLTRVVAWPGATLAGTIVDSVATGTGAVVSAGSAALRRGEPLTS